jgi:hypothetical protein
VAIFFGEELSGDFGMLESIEKSARWGPPPGNLHEYQTKGITKFAFRKLLILKDAILVVWGKQGRNGCPGKEKREQAPALHTQLSTG